MKVLLLSRYDRLGASSRLRTMQYLPMLADAGIDVDVAPLFDDDYLKRLYAGQGTRAAVARAFAGRVKRLRTMRDYDLVWLEKEALPWLPWPIERALLDSGVPIVSDYDDAIFHRYDLHRSGLVRRLLGRKIDRVMAASRLVVAGNDYLAERAHGAGARQVEIVPTVVDADVYGVRQEISVAGVPKIGWIGTPSTWAGYMAPLLPMLVDVAAAADTTVRAVGAGQAAAHPRIEVLDWSEDREVELIQSMAIGIMPLDDSPWARGKCGYKLIQYMACGLPVVAAAVGANREIVEHGVNGFLVETADEWREALQTLLQDPALRRRMGEEGRRRVEKEFSVQAHAPRMVNMLSRIAREGL